MSSANILLEFNNSRLLQDQDFTLRGFLLMAERDEYAELTD